jgi:hypothetical protein
LIQQVAVDRIKFATYSLICRLVKTGTIEPSEVSEFLRRCSAQNIDEINARLHFSRPQPIIPDTSTKSDTSMKNNDNSSGITELCGGVAALLATLRDCILTNGTAVLPPSRAAMGPPFVPALDYLRRLVLDAAAGGGSGDVEPCKRRRTVGTGGGSEST